MEERRIETMWLQGLILFVNTSVHDLRLTRNGAKLCDINKGHTWL